MDSILPQFYCKSIVFVSSLHVPALGHGFKLLLDGWAFCRRCKYDVAPVNGRRYTVASVDQLFPHGQFQDNRPAAQRPEQAAVVPAHSLGQKLCRAAQTRSACWLHGPGSEVKKQSRSNHLRPHHSITTQPRHWTVLRANVRKYAFIISSDRSVRCFRPLVQPFRADAFREYVSLF